MQLENSFRTTASPQREAQQLSGAIITFAVLGITVLAFPYYPMLNNPNENVRIYMTRAIVERATYEISTERGVYGWTNDAACVGYTQDEQVVTCDAPSVVRRRYYSVKAPGLSLLGTGPYLLLHWSGLSGQPDTVAYILRLMCVRIPLFFFFVLGGRWIRRNARSPDLATVVWIGTFLGSTFFANSLLFVSHSLAGACAFTSFVLSAGRPRIWRALCAGFCASFTTALEYPCLPLSAVLSFYGLKQAQDWRARIAFLCGAIIPTIAVMHFHTVAFGNAFSPGHRFVETVAFRSIHESGLFGIRLPNPEAFVGLLFSPRVGLLTTSPICLVPVLCLGLGRCWSSRYRVASLCILLLMLAISGFPSWHGDWTLGPRYLAPIVPFVAFFATSTSPGRKNLLLPLAVGLSIVSILFLGILSLHYPHLPPEIASPLLEAWLPLSYPRIPRSAGSLIHAQQFTGPMLLTFFALAVGVLPMICRPKQRWQTFVAASICSALFIFIVTTWSRDAHPSTRRIEAAMSVASQKW